MKKFGKTLTMSMLVVLSTNPFQVWAADPGLVGVSSVSNYVNIRKEASVSSAVLGTLYNNHTVAIQSSVQKEDGLWYEIQTSGIKGYVKAEYLRTSLSEETKELPVIARHPESGKTETTSIPPTLKKKPTLQVRQDLVTYAKQFIGNPYAYGGTSLTEGADCSGFTLSVYANFGYDIGRSSRDQADRGREVFLNQMQLGDLIFYADGDYINHVGIYIGEDQIVHSSTPQTGITTASAYFRQPYKVVTFFE